MKSRSSLFVLALVLAMLACNLPSNAATETPTLVVITPSVTQPASTDTPTQTSLPSNTPPPTSTTTPTVPVALPKDVAVNCRLGPGVGWIVLSGLSVGTSSQIVGKSGDGGWWYIVDPFNSSRRCWVASSVTNTAGNLASIPVVEAPKATVTKVTVDVDPKTLSVAGCVGPILPIEISGTIETNGPTSVKWHFETQQGGAMSNQTTDFDAFGSKNVSVDYTPTLTAGTYWVRLIVTEPNAVQAETKYTLECPP
jgi:hypothetical protein